MLGKQERELINDCFIGELMNQVYFIKKNIEGRIFLVYFLLDDDSVSIANFLFKFYFENIKKMIFNFFLNSAISMAISFRKYSEMCLMLLFKY